MMNKLWKALLSKVILLGYLSSTGAMAFGYYATKNVVDPTYLNWSMGLFVGTNMFAIAASTIMFVTANEVNVEK